MKNKVRFLIKDVLPFEVPIIHTNEYFIAKIVQYKNAFSRSVNIMLAKDDFSVPYNFYVMKNDGTQREMALIHPMSQLQWLAFICKYDRSIISLCQSRNLFSIRCPNSITPYYISNPYYKSSILDKLNKEFVTLGLSTKLTEDDLINQTYFSIAGYVNLQKFYDSYRFRNLEFKFKYLAKIDISKFFGSIYTHSISWSVSNSKIVAKNERNDRDNFASDFDKIMQRANYDETHGIVVGSELSRVFAEIILLGVERNLYKLLLSANLKRGVEYDIYRYVDDIHIFYNETAVFEKIKSEYGILLSEYKLYLNNSKTNIYNRPFILKRNWIVVIKNTLDLKVDDYIYLLDNSNLKTYSSTISQEKWVIKQQIAENHEISSVSSYVLSILLKNMLTFVNTYYTEKKHEEKIFKEQVDGEKKVKSLKRLDRLEKNLIMIINLNLELVFYILSIQPIYKNCIKVIKYILKLLVQLKDETKNIKNSINMKLHYEISQMLKYNSSNSELLNLIILSKYIESKLSSNLLMDFLKNFDYDYFTYTTILFYIYDYKSNRLRDDNYSDILQYIQEKMAKIKELLMKENIIDACSCKYFYLINDLSLCPALNPKLRKKLRELLGLYNHIDKKSKYKSKELLKLILRNNVSFTNWNMSLEETVVETSIVDYRAKRQYD